MPRTAQVMGLVKERLIPSIRHMHDVACRAGGECERSRGLDRSTSTTGRAIMTKTIHKTAGRRAAPAGEAQDFGKMAATG